MRGAPPNRRQTVGFPVTELPPSGILRRCFTLLAPLLLLPALLGACGSKDERIDQAFDAQVPITIRTVYLVDDRFPGLDQPTLEKAVKVAQQVAQERFALQKLTFLPLEVRPIGPWFTGVLGTAHPKEATYPLRKSVSRQMNNEQEQFYRQFDLKELLGFLPPEKAAGATLADFHRYLMQTWEMKLAKFKALQYQGKSVFTPEQSPWQLASNWMEVFRRQRGYDFMLTNTAIFYDLLDNPYPHTIFKHAKMGGMGEKSPHAPNGRGHAAMASLVGFTNIEYLHEADLPAEEAAEGLGAVLMAHELGHMLFELEDYYDHPRDCLMNTPPAALGYHDAWVALNPAHRVCPKCRPLITAAKEHWLDSLQTRR